MKYKEIFEEVEGVLGPHAGKELQFLLSGKKKIAMVDPSKRSEFMPYVKQGLFKHDKIKCLSSRYNNRSNRHVSDLYYVPGEKWRAIKLQQIYDDIYNKNRRMTDDDHIQLGKLFGYSDTDISKFLSRK